MEWKEDEFQLLWNLVYHHNQYPSDFSTFRKVVQNDTDQHKKLLEKENNVSAEDLNLFKLVDTAEEAVQVIDEFYGRYMLKPNF